MKTYKAEASVAHLLTDNTLSFAAACSKAPKEHEGGILAHKLAMASMPNIEIPDTDDLFYVQSILVSTVWNKNDDVFLPIPTWAARHTPVHKPTNIEHNEKLVVGHITSQWAIDANGNIIDDTISSDDLPNMYHLCNGGVIYRQWRDPEFAEQVEQMIRSIEAGKKYVSMECLFAGFDYALKGADDFRIVARNEQTAFLTKYLRSYGGVGEYEGYKVGRALQNITFSGKGFVDKPANPASIIFTNDEIEELNFIKASSENPFNLKDGVYLDSKINKKKETHIMSDMLEKQLAETKISLAEQNKIVTGLRDELAQSNVKKLQDQNDSLVDQLKAADTAKADLTSKLEKSEKALSCRCDEYKTLEGEMVTFKEKLAVSEKKALDASRVYSLVTGGMGETAAVEAVATCEGLSKEQFELMSKALLAALHNKKDDEKKQKDKDKEKEMKLRKADSGTSDTDVEAEVSEETDTEVVESADPESAAASVGAVDSDPESEHEQARATISDFFDRAINKKTKKEIS